MPKPSSKNCQKCFKTEATCKFSLPKGEVWEVCEKCATCQKCQKEVAEVITEKETWLCKNCSRDEGENGKPQEPNTKKCDNCQQSNNEGYYQIKVKGGKIVNFCKECIICHDCKQKEGEGLWNDKLYLCKACMNKRKQNENNRNSGYCCAKCNKDLVAVGGIRIYWVVKELKMIKQYGVEAPNYDKIVGHWCDNCWKKAQEPFKNNPVMWKGKFGKYTKYVIEKNEYEKDQFGIGGGRKWEVWWHENTQEWKTTIPTDKDKTHTHTERERDEFPNFELGLLN